MGRVFTNLSTGHQQTLLNLMRCYDLSGEDCEKIVESIDDLIRLALHSKTDPQPQITAAIANFDRVGDSIKHPPRHLLQGAMQHNNFNDSYGDVYGTDNPKAPNAISDTPSSSLTDKGSIIAGSEDAQVGSIVASHEPSANARAITRDIVGAEQLALWIDEQGELFQWISNAINALDTKITAHEKNYGHTKAIRNG